MSETKALTEAELKSLVLETAKEAIAPAVDAALEPLRQKQASFEVMLHKEPAPDKEPPGLKFARAARIIALGKGDTQRGLHEARKHWGAHAFDNDPVVKGLTAASAAAAGNLILPAGSREMIELLRNREVFGRIPAVRRVPMPNGSLTFRKQTSAGTAYYVSEPANATASTQGVGTLSLSAKKCVGLTAVSNDLLRQAGPDADAFVRDDLLKIVTLKRDLSFLTGDGTASTPRGVLNTVDSANSNAQTGTTLSYVQADYPKAIKLIQAANIDANPSNAAWVMCAQVYWGLYKLATTDGDMLFRNELVTYRFLGFPIVISEQQGTSRVFFICGEQCLVGETLNMQVDAFDGAAYYDGSSVVSGVSRDETVIRVIDEHDFALRHDKGASVITSVTLS
jgi:HK97 family phage major capsid protein